MPYFANSLLAGSTLYSLPNSAAPGDGYSLTTQGGALDWSEAGGAGALLAANNLSDLASAPDARNNLGLGSMAVESSGSYLTSAQTNSAIAAAIAALVGTAPGVLDTLGEISDAINDDADLYGTLVSALAGKQDLDATLTALAGVTVAANQLIYATGSDQFSTTPLTAAARSLLDDATGADMLATLAGAAATGSGGVVRATGPTIAGATVSAQLTASANAAASTPPMIITGSMFTGGTSTTTKPTVLIEPAGTTSTGWSTAGTALGINLPSGSTSNALDCQINGVQQTFVNAAGDIRMVCKIPSVGNLQIKSNTGGIFTEPVFYIGIPGLETNGLAFRSNGSMQFSNGIQLHPSSDFLVGVSSSYGMQRGLNQGFYLATEGEPTNARYTFNANDITNANSTWRVKTDTTNGIGHSVEYRTWATATHASRKGRVRYTIYDTAEREFLRGEASGSAAMIGFLGASAIIRRTTSDGASTFAANSSGIADDSATWGGYTVGQVVKALIDFGLLT